MQRRCFLLLFFSGVIGCGQVTTPKPTLRLATTTSTQDTGLLDELLPAFEKKTGIHVDAVAVGSGQALQLGRRGDADVLLTHSPKAEDEFEKEGFAASRHRVMYNEFVLIGPSADPAGAAGSKEIGRAFQTISQARQPFISRGDNSGTHQKERSILGHSQDSARGNLVCGGGDGDDRSHLRSPEGQGFDWAIRSGKVRTGPVRSRCNTSLTEISRSYAV